MIIQLRIRKKKEKKENSGLILEGVNILLLFLIKLNVLFLKKIYSVSISCNVGFKDIIYILVVLFLIGWGFNIYFYMWWIWGFVFAIMWVWSLLVFCFLFKAHVKKFERVVKLK